MDTGTVVAALPTPAQGREALVHFVCTLATIVRSHKDNRDLAWTTEAAKEIVDLVRDQFSEEDVEKLLEDPDDPSGLATSILFREIVYIARKFAGLNRQMFDLEPIDEELYIDVAPEPIAGFADISKADVERIEVVHGSIEKLFKKLPAWMQKILDVGMELLKLTRGIAG